jgi:inorganic pyrophosphatase
MNKNPAKGINGLNAFNEETKDLNVIVEAPRGSRNKYKFDEERELLMLDGILPLGATFPFDFGFIPNTLGEDGDPLDVLVLMDEPAFAGCLVPARLIGVIEANQTEEGKIVRNDRLIAVASKSQTHSQVKSIEDLNEIIIDQIEHFFISYNEVKDKQFAPLNRLNADGAQRLVEEGVKRQLAKRKRRKKVSSKKT